MATQNTTDGAMEQAAPKGKSFTLAEAQKLVGHGDRPARLAVSRCLP